MRRFFSFLFRWTIVLTSHALLLVVAAFVISTIIVLSGMRGSDIAPADCAVVFGAAVHGTDRPGPAIYRRMDTAIRLLSAGTVQRLIVTGGKGSDETDPESDVMRDYALSRGIDAALIVTEDRAKSTLENLRFSGPLAANCQSVIGISDGYHLSRIRLLAHLQGWEHFATYPSDIKPTRAFLLQSIVREAAGYIYYGARLNDLLQL